MASKPAIGSKEEIEELNELLKEVIVNYYEIIERWEKRPTKRKGMQLKRHLMAMGTIMKQLKHELVKFETIGEFSKHANNITVWNEQVRDAMALANENRKKRLELEKDLTFRECFKMPSIKK